MRRLYKCANNYQEVADMLKLNKSKCLSIIRKGLKRNGKIKELIQYFIDYLNQEDTINEAVEYGLTTSDIFKRAEFNQYPYQFIAKAVQSDLAWNMDNNLMKKCMTFLKKNAVSAFKDGNMSDDNKFINVVLKRYNLSLKDFLNYILFNDGEINITYFVEQNDLEVGINKNLVRDIQSKKRKELKEKEKQKQTNENSNLEVNNNSRNINDNFININRILKRMYKDARKMK